MAPPHAVIGWGDGRRHSREYPRQPCSWGSESARSKWSCWRGCLRDDLLPAPASPAWARVCDLGANADSTMWTRSAGGTKNGWRYRASDCAWSGPGSGVSLGFSRPLPSGLSRGWPGLPARGLIVAVHFRVRWPRRGIVDGWRGRGGRERNVRAAKARTRSQPSTIVKGTARGLRQ